MTSQYLIVASMGTGMRWLEEILLKFGVLNLVRWLPAMPDDYRQTIRKNPMLLKIDSQNHAFRINAPLDCLLEEIEAKYPTKPLTVVSHFHDAHSLWNNYQKYPSKIAHKVMYLYGCPLKRTRSSIKNQLYYIALGSVDVPAMVDGIKGNKAISDLINDTEKHFNIQLSDLQKAVFAHQIYLNINISHDMERASFLDFRMVNFEQLKSDAHILSDLLKWASENTIIPDDSLLIDLYAKNSTMGLNSYELAIEADSNQSEFMNAPYEGQAIWNAMNDWQRYFYRQAIKTLSTDYIEFHKELGIDLSYMSS